ncbi:MAG: DUF2142 domain-containing protein [Ilumatobacteraceae bacterium]
MLVPVALVAAVVGCWILGSAPSSGPDEPAHVIRSAELIRGHLDGMLGSDPGTGLAELPAWIGSPDPVCFAQHPYTPASRATTDPTPDGTEIRYTAATSYPIWGHLTASLGTLAPASVGTWSVRVASAVPPVLLLGCALVVAARRSRLTAIAVFASLTPMAWFTLGVVNPSALVIAGGVALAASAPEAVTGSRSQRWLVVAAWAAMALPRRDGLIWASVGLGVVLIGLGIPAGAWLRSFSRPQLAMLGLSTAWPVVAGLRGEAGAMRFIVLAPIALVGAVGVEWAWKRWADTTAKRIAGTGLLIVGGLVGYALLAMQRSNGFDRYYLRLVLHRTGENLTEAIGVMGWLDTPVPASAVLLWAVAFGLLASAAIQAGAMRIVWSAVAVVAAAIVASWVIESVHDAYSGTYWQGRYYLPLLVFAPILLGRVSIPDAVARRLSTAVGIAVLIVINVAFAASMRRWGVGLAGSMLPWDWDTYATPVAPVVLLGVHVGATVTLAGWCAQWFSWRGDPQRVGASDPDTAVTSTW